MDFNKHLLQLRSCTLCQDKLPLRPNPVVQLDPHATVLIVGQAPGRKADESTTPFNDPSGDRLRIWLRLSREEFYDKSKVALMPMGFCYPGRNPKGGDLPPQPACAPLWHRATLACLPNIRLTLLVGQYAQKHYLGDRSKSTLTETVKAWKEYAPEYFPLPHPSWRNNGWLRAHPWFEAEMLGDLRAAVAEALGK